MNKIVEGLLKYSPITAHYSLRDNKQVLFCQICEATDNHKEDCPYRLAVEAKQAIEDDSITVKAGNKYKREYRNIANNKHNISVVIHVISIDKEYCFVKYWRNKKWNYEVKHLSFFECYDDSIVIVKDLGESDRL